MKTQQIYHKDIPQQSKETITEELEKTRQTVQDIQDDLKQIEEVLFKLQENKKYLKFLFTDIKQPQEVALFYELSYKYDILKRKSINRGLYLQGLHQSIQTNKFQHCELKSIPRHINTIIFQR